LLTKNSLIYYIMLFSKAIKEKLPF
jgi:hypothetical protein